MAPARKVYTEAMIRRVMKNHFEVEIPQPNLQEEQSFCECGWWGENGRFEDHFIDQLHKLWHEMFGRTSTSTTPATDPYTISTRADEIPANIAIASAP